MSDTFAYARPLRKERAAAWSDPNLFATSLLALLLDQWGAEAMGWEPETIRLEVLQTTGKRIPDGSVDRLMALIGALRSPLFYTNVETFLHTANALSGAPVNFEVWDPVDVEEAAWAITEVAFNDPPDKDERIADRFSPDVRKLLGVLLDNEGIERTPPQLSMAIRQTKPDMDAELSFADEPVMGESFLRRQEEEVRQIGQEMEANLSALLQQLGELPLSRRSEADWQAYVQRILPGSRKGTRSAMA